MLRVVAALSVAGAAARPFRRLTGLDAGNDFNLGAFPFSFLTLHVGDGERNYGNTEPGIALPLYVNEYYGFRTDEVGQPPALDYDSAVDSFQTIALPQDRSSDYRPCTLARGVGEWNFEEDGMIQNSGDEAYLLVPCFAVPVGQPITGSSPKTIAVIGTNTIWDTQTGFTGGGVGFRMVASVTGWAPYYTVASRAADAANTGIGYLATQSSSPPTNVCPGSVPGCSSNMGALHMARQYASYAGGMERFKVYTADPCAGGSCTPAVYTAPLNFATPLTPSTMLALAANLSNVPGASGLAFGEDSNLLYVTYTDVTVKGTFYKSYMERYSFDTPVQDVYTGLASGSPDPNNRVLWTYFQAVQSETVVYAVTESHRLLACDFRNGFLSIDMQVPPRPHPSSVLRSSWVAPITPISATPTATETPSSTASSTRTASSSITRTASSSVTRTPSASITRTASSSRTRTPSASITRTASSSRTGTPSASITRTASSSITRTASSSRTRTPSASITRTASSSRTGTPSSSITRTASSSVTRTASSSRTQTPSASITRTASSSRTGTPSVSITRTASSSITRTPSATQTTTPSSRETATGTRSSTATETTTPSASVTRTPSSSVTRTASGSRTGTPSTSVTRTGSSSATQTPSSSVTRTASRSNTRTPSASRTGTPSTSVTRTASSSATRTSSSSRTRTASSSVTRSSAGTVTPTGTVTPAVTQTPSNSPAAVNTTNCTCPPDDNDEEDDHDDGGSNGDDDNDGGSGSSSSGSDDDRSGSVGGSGAGEDDDGHRRLTGGDDDGSSSSGGTTHDGDDDGGSDGDDDNDKVVDACVCPKRSRKPTPSKKATPTPRGSSSRTKTKQSRATPSSTVSKQRRVVSSSGDDDGRGSGREDDRKKSWNGGKEVDGAFRDFSRDGGKVLSVGKYDAKDSGKKKQQ